MRIKRISGLSVRLHGVFVHTGPAQSFLDRFLVVQVEPVAKKRKR